MKQERAPGTTDSFRRFLALSFPFWMQEQEPDSPLEEARFKLAACTLTSNPRYFILALRLF